MRTGTLQDLLAWAQLSGIDVSAMLTAQRTLKAVSKGDLKKLNLEAGMYTEAKKNGISFSELLEQLDPSDPEKHGNMTAFQRQLAVRDLEVSGSGAVTLEEWYNQPESRVLFPEFLQQQIRIGMLMGKYTLKHEDLVATTTTINSGAYESSTVDETQDVSAGIVGQGAGMPVISLNVGTATIKLKKHGLVLKQTYEHMRRLRANKMAVFLQLAGQRMMLDETEDAVNVTINGDGNSNSAPVDSLGGISYAHFVEFLAEFEPYNMDLLVTDKAGWTAINSLTEFSDSIIASNFINTGNPINPFGGVVKRHDPTSEILSNKILGVDRTKALERIIEANASLVESENLITSQWNQIAISEVIGFARLIANGARVWDLADDLP